MSKSMIIWLVLSLVGTGCAAMETMLGNLTSPAGREAAGEMIQQGAEAAGISKTMAASLSAVGTALLGLVGSFFADKKANKRKRKEQWEKIGEIEKKMNGGSGPPAGSSSPCP